MCDLGDGWWFSSSNFVGLRYISDREALVETCCALISGVEIGFVGVLECRIRCILQDGYNEKTSANQVFPSFATARGSPRSSPATLVRVAHDVG